MRAMTTRVELPERIVRALSAIPDNATRDELRAAIREECARLEAAARREGYNERIKGQRLVTTRVLEERVAAARLAGRLEQAEKTIQIDRDDTLYPGKDLFEALIEERDRLRELAAAGKGEK